MECEKIAGGMNAMDTLNAVGRRCSARHCDPTRRLTGGETRRMLDLPPHDVTAFGRF